MAEAYAAQVAAGNLRADAVQEAVLPLFDRLITDMEARPAPKAGLFGLFSKSLEPVRGIYLWGGVGRGKSMLMDLFHEVAPIEQKRRVHFHAFMQEVQDALHEARKGEVEDAILPVAEAIIAETQLLNFDEMQITDIADAMIVGRLFERLFAAGVAVVTTSNRVPGDLYKDGLNRALFLPFIDLLDQRMVVHEMASDTDYRQGRLEGEQVYFAPANRETRAVMREIFADLTRGETPPLDLAVKGRKVTIPAYRNGVGRARFHDLCGLPLGPADFLAVAEACRVLVLEDIPQLGRSNFNEAKRFVTLIDALYEARVRLICSAAAKPEFLYVEGEGSFEFERTASRLREMQSEGWGK
ncbi:AFG1 family ATPase [Actibacterium sp. 188UL27-1]|nr:cell division protein ZapE [Actibacterium sp. 188UL27-1]MBM7069846.1 AFG1 family ATPase [Actibacterium sp. 188UL27-1]